MCLILCAGVGLNLCWFNFFFVYPAFCVLFSEPFCYTFSPDMSLEFGHKKHHTSVLNTDHTHITDNNEAYPFRPLVYVVTSL